MASARTASSAGLVPDRDAIEDSAGQAAHDRSGAAQPAAVAPAAQGGPGTAKAQAGAAAALAVPMGAAGLAAVIFWLLVGDLGMVMRDRAALPSGLELLRRNGASDTVTSLLLSTLPALLSVLLVPLIAYHSDRSRSRWGRRRPFLLAVAPVGCAALLGLACTPLLGAWTHAALGAWSPGPRSCNLIWFGLFWTSFECAAVSTASLYSGLVNDVVPSGLLGRFYAGIRVISLGVGIAFNSWVFALTDHHLYSVLAGTALVYGAAIVLMCVMVREVRYPGAAEAPSSTSSSARRTLAVPRTHILACFAQRPFWWTVAAFMLASVTFSPFNTFYQYYAHESGISKATLGSLTAWGYSVSIVSAFGIGWLVDRYGALRLSLLFMGLYCAAAGAGYVLLHDAASFRVFYLAHIMISGAYFTAAASLPMALFPHARFVQYNSTKDLMVVFGNILVSSAQGPILDGSGHDYHLTLLSGAVFSLGCLCCLMRLQAAMRRLQQT
ncbi:MFS transporter [Oxalobacteraceae bacterium A2-2]